MAEETSARIEDQLEALRKKFDAMGQDLGNQLEGFSHAKPVDYWDYVQTDALLNLQVQRTLVPDEMVFIMYHQINELLFKMILWEIGQVADEKELKPDFFSEKLGRISRYFDMLTASFSIMREGMDLQQYLKFRLTLSPASGFQSAQYRQIEFASTDLVNLIDARFREPASPAGRSFKSELENRDTLDDGFYDRAFEHLYWQAAGKDYETGKKTFTLAQFEAKYKGPLLRSIKKYKSLNLYARFKNLPKSVQQDEVLVRAMRHYDHTVNIKWVMAHYRTAKHYLNQGKEPLEATGGSPWVKYMLPKYQRRIFFPSLWSEKELATWGQNE